MRINSGRASSSVVDTQKTRRRKRTEASNTVAQRFDRRRRGERESLERGGACPVLPRIICKRACTATEDENGTARAEVFVSIAKRHNGGSMLITDFRKGNAPGVDACLTLRECISVRGKSDTHAASRTTEREREKDRLWLYTRIVSFQPPVLAAGSSRILVRCEHPRKHDCHGGKKKKIEGTI